jgi:5-hydroxyisourate hydrolase-like protein (transthyretin family)
VNTISKRMATALKMMGLYAIVAAFALAAFPGSSFAASASLSSSDVTGKVTVSVFDGQKATAISGAVIYVYSASSPSTLPIAKAQTDANGRTTLELPQGSYHLKIVAPGYKDGNITVQVIANVHTEYGVKLFPPTPVISNSIAN